MAGLEKITDQILADAKTQADEIVAQANASAEQILSDAKARAQDAAAASEKKSAADVDTYEKRVASSNDLYRRTQTLRAKQEMITEVLNEAYARVCALDDASYFDLLEKAVSTYALPQDGEIIFAAQDQARMPQDFVQRVEKAAQAAGGSLTVSEEKRGIENGFILVYGGIEENCTIQALFDVKKEQLQDLIGARLYGKEA